MRFAAAVLTVGAMLLGAAQAPAAGPSASVEPTWSAIGLSPGQSPTPPTVTAAAINGQRLYMAGNIGGLARLTGPLGSFDAASGEATASPTFLERPASGDWSVTAIAADAQGGWYVAGGFSGASDGATSLTQPNLVHYTADGRVDRAFAPVIPDSAEKPRVDAIAVAPDGTVYVGGSFITIAGVGRVGLAALNGRTGALRASFNARLNNAVREIELGADGMYIAGEFTEVNGTPREGVAKISLSNGSLVNGWDAKVKGASATSESPTLELAGTTLYIGGYFAPATPGERTVGNASLHHLAAVNAATGAPDATWAPDPNGPVHAIAVDGSRVFVGGAFNKIGTQSSQPAVGAAAMVAAASGVADASWNPVPRPEPIPGRPIERPVIGEILPVGDTVYLASGPDRDNTERFTELQAQSRCAVGAVSAPDGAAPVARDWNPHPVHNTGSQCSQSTKVLAMEQIGGRIAVGGDFQFANLRPRQGLAAIDLASGEPLPWAPATDGGAPDDDRDDPTYGDVRDMEVSPDGGTVYLAGRFAEVNRQNAVRLAAVDASGAANGAAAVRTGWAAPDNEVRAIELSADGQTLYAGGGFAKVGTATRSRLAAFTTATGALAPLVFKAPSASVWDLERSPEGTLFAAGAFTTVGAPAVTRSHVAEFDAATGGLLPWDGGLPASAEVEDVAFAGDVVYVAGRFTGAVGGQSRANVAALRRSDGSATAWAPQPDKQVRRVSVAADGTVYLTGAFDNLGGVSQAGAASVDAGGQVTNWRPAGVIASSDPTRSVPEILFPDATTVVVGGPFTTVSGRPQGGFAVFGPAAAPGAVASPTVTGVAEIGRAVQCEPGAWSGSAPFVRELTWLRAGEPIPGATTNRYVISDEDSGLGLSCRERVANTAGEAVQTSSEVVTNLEPPSIGVAPVVAGEPYVEREALCSTGLWLNRPSQYSYQWLMDGEPIAGATDRGYRLGADARGRLIGCEVVAANSAGPGAPARSLGVRVTQAPPRSLAAPRVLGGDTAGTELTCDPGSWEGAASLTFEWLRDGSDIAGATGERYRAITADAAHVVACRVTAHNDDHRTVAESAAQLIRGGASAQQRARQTPADDADDDLPARLDVRKAKLRGGWLRVTLRAPIAGRVSVRATIAAKGKARTIGRAATTAERSGAVSVRIKLSKSSRRTLERAGSKGLRVTLKAELAPGEGKKLTDTARVTLKEKRS